MKRGRPPHHAYCWAHARRNFFKLADLDRTSISRRQSSADKPISPIAREAVRRIDELFAIERDIKGLSGIERLAIRREQSGPRVAALEAWMRLHRESMSKHADNAKAIDYLLSRWKGFTVFLEDARISLDNNAAERALRSIAVGRKNWIFCGSDRGGQSAAVIYSLIGTCKLNNVDPQAWLADVLGRIAEHPAKKLDELLPWKWKASQTPVKLAA